MSSEFLPSDEDLSTIDLANLPLTGTGPTPPDPFFQYADAADEQTRARLIAEREKRINAIRIREDPKTINTMVIRKYKSDYADRFLKSLGRHPDHYQEPPTEEQLKSHQAKRAKLTTWPQKKKRDTEAVGFIPYQFSLLQNFKEDAVEYGRLKQCASLAIQDYNITKNTKYRFDDDGILNVGWVYNSGVLYFIIFKANNSEGTTTFEAKVRRKRLRRLSGKAVSISVEAVKIRRYPDEKKRVPLRWVTGCLRELIS